MSEESEVVEVEPADDKSPAPEAEAKPVDDVSQTAEEPAVLSQHDAARRNYQRDGAENAATKQARKVAINERKV